MLRAWHERFVREYIKNGGNGAAAYRKATMLGYTHPASDRTGAYRLLRKPYVRKRYEELRQQMARRADITIDKVLTDYQEALLMAKSQGKPGEMVAAATAQAKLVGLLRERVEAGNVGDFDRLENVSDIIALVEESAGPEAAMLLAEMAEKMGFAGVQKEKAPQAEPEETQLEALEPPSDAVN